MASSASSSSSSSSSSDNFGWELLLAATQADFSRQDDASFAADLLVSFVHWRLLCQDLRCVGRGQHFDSVHDPGQGTFTELLPDQWNRADDNGNVCLRYRHRHVPAQKYLLQVTRNPPGTLVVVLICLADEKVANVTINSDSFVKEKVLVSQDELMKRVKDDLLEPLLGEDKKKKEEKEKKEPDQHRRRDPLMVGEPRYPGGRHPAYPLPGNPYGDPLGGADLDPLGRGGRGMLFEPPGRGGGLGGFGGGPRFDPVHPHFPNMGRGGDLGGGGGMPGNRNLGDEMRPPGFDDMFG